MKRQVLILGGNLPGLIAAYRLIPYGFQITIVEPGSPFSRETSCHNPLEPTVSENPTFSANLNGQGAPLILHGFYHSTWSFLEELALEYPGRSFQQVNLEFAKKGGETVMLSGSPSFSRLPAIIRLALFNGLTWMDRWNLINFLEKKWEEYSPPDHHPDTLTVESWLVSAGQSALAIEEIWRPLCRFFLGCGPTQASLGYFLEILTRFWIPKTNGPEIFLTSPDMLDHLYMELRRILIAKGVKYCLPQIITRIDADTNGIQAILLANGERLTADAYISTLPPTDLLSLLPDRAAARFSCFSHLEHLHEVSGTTVQWTLNNTLLPPRLILNSGQFDWVITQTVSDRLTPKTIVTCVNLDPISSHGQIDAELSEAAWTQIQHLLHLSPELFLSSGNPQPIQSPYPFFPCQTGFRTFRPLPNTPIPNLFLAGPWTATQLPPCLENTVTSAYTCARALAEFAQASSH